MPAGIAQLKAKSLPLMDGGVFDNQGMQSLEMRVRETGVDMILISDTDRESEALYTMPQSVASLVRDKDANMIWKLLIGWNPSLNCLAWLSLFVQWSCGLYAAVIGANIWTAQLTTVPRPSIIWMLLSNTVPLGLTIITLVLTTLFRSIFKNKLLARVPQLKTAGWKYLKKVNLVGLVDMIWLRASSLVTLVSDVFMKRIRSGSYRSIYGDPDYQDKLAANLIYSSQNPWPFHDPATDDKNALPGLNAAFEAQLKSIRTPSDELLKVAKTAAEIATLLWS